MQYTKRNLKKVKRECNKEVHTYWRCLIIAALLYMLGVVLILRGLLYPALFVMACGGACFHIGLRQIRKQRIRSIRDAQQKLAAPENFYYKPLYSGESETIVEEHKTHQDIYGLEEHIEPILVLQINRGITRNDLHSYITIWEQRLAREEPFAVLIAQNEEESQSDQEIIKLGYQWHRSHKSLTGQYCAGIAVVTISARLLESRCSVTRAIHMWLGCPGQICTTEIEARAWLCEQLAQSKKIS